MSMFGTALNPTYLITEQWIAREFVATDLIFIGRRDEDFVGGYKPHIMEMRTLRDILWEDISITDLTDTPSTLGNPGQVLEVDPTGQFLIWADINPIDEFLELLDTPSDYIGFAGFNVTVNNTEDGLEFTPPVSLTPQYEARISFNGTSNPIVNQLLSSNLGPSISWSRTGVGTYIATFSSTVSSPKLAAYIGNTSSGVFRVSSYNSLFVQFEHRDFTGTLSDPTDFVSVEIKLYP